MWAVIQPRWGIFNVGLLAGIAFMVLAGCDNTDHSPPGAQKKIEVSTRPTTDAVDAVAPQNITVNGLGFDPSTLTVSRGTTVVWTNGTNNACSVVSGVPQKPGAGPLSGELGAKDATYTYKFDIPGEYPYFNEIQPIQAGKVIVNP